MQITLVFLNSSVTFVTTLTYFEFAIFMNVFEFFFKPSIKGYRLSFRHMCCYSKHLLIDFITLSDY